VDMLMVNDGRAAERDAQFTKAIDELKGAVTEVSKVVSEVNMLVRTVRRLSPGEMPAVKDKRREP
jgi:predicted RND superfamily exporter protein